MQEQRNLTMINSLLVLVPMCWGFCWAGQPRPFDARGFSTHISTRSFRLAAVNFSGLHTPKVVARRHVIDASRLQLANCKIFQNPHPTGMGPLGLLELIERPGGTRNAFLSSPAVPRS